VRTAFPNTENESQNGGEKVNIDSLLEFEVITDLLEENDNNKIYDDSGIVFGVVSKKEKVANVSNFAEETVPGMDDNEFR
jgi:ABC-type transport system involved in Fe-S cluster assembly fused permease/ATPase subunit